MAIKPRQIISYLFDLKKKNTQTTYSALISFESVRYHFLHTTVCFCSHIPESAAAFPKEFFVVEDDCSNEKEKKKTHGWVIKQERLLCCAVDVF